MVAFVVILCLFSFSLWLMRFSLLAAVFFDSDKIWAIGKNKFMRRKCLLSGRFGSRM